MPSFLERFRHATLEEVFSDQTPISILSDRLSWLDLPNSDFLDYTRSISRSSFDALPPRAELYRDDTSFLHAQSHRIWLTLKKLSELLPMGPDAVLLNLGAYPFAIDLAVRQFLGNRCRIVATVNQELSQDLQATLLKHRIETLPVNLDPYVAAGDAPPGQVDRLLLPDNSTDCVLFAHVIEHLYHPLFVLKEAIRVLKPGGYILLTTDNAFLLSALLEFLGECGSLHEPVEGTAAMTFHAWRGHVRFYSSLDIRTMLTAAGARIEGVKLCEVIYNSVPQEYFRSPQLEIPAWRASILGEFDQFRNELLVWARKPALALADK